MKNAGAQYKQLQASAVAAQRSRLRRGIKKSSQAEGLFKQVCKTIRLLQQNPQHPGLQTHKYYSLEHPWDRKQSVFEAYVQQNTPGAYRS